MMWKRLLLENEFQIRRKAEKEIERWLKRKRPCAMHFDFDMGVADTSRANTETVRQTLREFKVAPRREALERFPEICCGLKPNTILLTIAPSLAAHPGKMDEMLKFMTEKAIENTHLIEISPIGKMLPYIREHGGTKSTIMTNRNKHAINPAIDYLKLRGFLDYIFYVSKILKAKPDLEMFYAGQKWTKIPLSQSLFVDDNEECIRAARSVGMGTFHVKWKMSMKMI